MAWAILSQSCRAAFDQLHKALLAEQLAALARLGDAVGVEHEVVLEREHTWRRHSPGEGAQGRTKGQSSDRLERADRWMGAGWPALARHVAGGRVEHAEKAVTWGSPARSRNRSSLVLRRMKAGRVSIVAKARTVLRTVSVRPAARTPLPATSPISTATRHVDHKDVAEVAAHELGLDGRL